MQAEAERARPEQLRPLRVRPERRATRSGWLAPVAVALVVAMTIAGVTVAVQASGLLSGPHGNSEPVNGAVSKPPWPSQGDRMPAYYVAVDFGPAIHDDQAITMTAVVRGSATGALLGRLALPSLNASSAGPVITAAGDDRHFVIALPTWPSGETRFYLLTLDSSGRVASLAALPIHPLPAREIVGGIALTPDGTQLAVAAHLPWPSSHYRGHPPTAEIRAVNLVTGSVRTWTTHQAIPSDGGPSEPSWAEGGRLLGFMWNEHDGVPGHGLYLLKTAAPGTNLMAARRLFQGVGLALDGYLTANGQTVIADMKAPDPASASFEDGYPSIAEYSARTGRLLRALYGPPRTATTESYDVVSVDPSGKYLLVTAPKFGRLVNGTFTPLAFKHGEVPIAAW